MAFESCSGYESFTPEDGDCRPWVDRLIGCHETRTEEYLQGMVDLHNNDNFLRGVERCKLIQGDIRVTVEEFAKKRTGDPPESALFRRQRFRTDAGRPAPSLPAGAIPAASSRFNAYGFSLPGRARPRQ
jgi:hypothetical protein